MVCLLLMVVCAFGCGCDSCSAACCVTLWLCCWQSWPDCCVALSVMLSIVFALFSVGCGWSCDLCVSLITRANVQTFSLSVGVGVWLHGWINSPFQSIWVMIHSSVLLTFTSSLTLCIDFCHFLFWGWQQNHLHPIKTCFSSALCLYSCCNCLIQLPVQHGSHCLTLQISGYLLYFS